MRVAVVALAVACTAAMLGAQATRRRPRAARPKAAIVISVDTTSVPRRDTAEYRACTLDARNGIGILVLDSLTGERLTLRAIALVRRKGAKVDTGAFRIYRGDNLPERIDDRHWLPLARERPGVYDIEVRVAGYRPWFAKHVVVRSDGCHVVLVPLTARLVRDPNAGPDQSRAAPPREATYARVVRDADLFDLARADSAYTTLAETLWLHRDGTYQLHRLERAVDSAGLAHRREIGITGRYAVLRTVWPPAESQKEFYATHRLYFRGASANFSADEAAGFASLTDAGWLDALDDGAELTGGGPDPPPLPRINRLPAPRVYRRVDQR
jgi:hypothetical protein